MSQSFKQKAGQAGADRTWEYEALSRQDLRAWMPPEDVEKLLGPPDHVKRLYPGQLFDALYSYELGEGKTADLYFRGGRLVQTYAGLEMCNEIIDQHLLTWEDAGDDPDVTELRFLFDYEYVGTGLEGIERVKQLPLKKGAILTIRAPRSGRAALAFSTTLLGVQTFWSWRGVYVADVRGGQYFMGPD